MESRIPTFARTEPPDTQVTKSVISLINYYDWKKFSIIYEEVWATVANSLKDQAQKRNMTINHIEKVVDVRRCCENGWDCCVQSISVPWYQVRFCNFCALYGLNTLVRRQIRHFYINKVELLLGKHKF